VTTKVIIPKAGMGTTEATVAKWLKAEGDRVTAGEVIVEVETAKALEEVAAPVTGTLTKILLTEGETADVFAEIAVIDEDS
jgi:pyruvate/2-oxoglutarate dehydrogenase complex dihydrolipoamide acyltransferase (E2) component